MWRIMEPNTLRSFIIFYWFNSTDSLVTMSWTADSNIPNGLCMSHSNRNNEMNNYRLNYNPLEWNFNGWIDLWIMTSGDAIISNSNPLNIKWTNDVEYFIVYFMHASEMSWEIVSQDVAIKFSHFAYSHWKRFQCKQFIRHSRQKSIDAFKQ